MGGGSQRPEAQIPESLGDADFGVRRGHPLHFCWSTLEGGGQKWDQSRHQLLRRCLLLHAERLHLPGGTLSCGLAVE